MVKRAYNLQMSRDITPVEKAGAEKAVLVFDHTVKELNKATDHVLIMLTPFKDNPDIPEEELIEFRSNLRDYRDRLMDNFKTFKEAAFQCIVALNPFSMDTETTKIKKSFIALVDELETEVNKFAELFSNLKDKAFIQSAVASLTLIDTKSEEIKEFIEDRAKNHIQKEILGKTWMDSISDEFNIKVDRPMPKLLELEEDRKKQLNDLAGNNHPISNWQG
jgi:hypothetical protein